MLPENVSVADLFPIMRKLNQFAARFDADGASVTARAALGALDEVRTIVDLLQARMLPLSYKYRRRKRS